MGSALQAVISPKRIEDPLAYLPRKSITSYKKGQIIFTQGQSATGLHLVVKGLVKVFIPKNGSCSLVLDILPAEEFFGESGILGCPEREDSAVALEKTDLMSWNTQEIEEQMERQPRLGIALIQKLTNRVVDLEHRLESSALDLTPRRVARCLLRFAERLGKEGSDGARHLPPLSHQLISEYAGTSREVVTFNMNRLRQQGYVQYSRRGITVHLQALREELMTMQQE